MSFLNVRTLIAIVGLLLFALFIWFVGPFFTFGFGESQIQPLGSGLVRLIVILLAVGAWAGSFVYARIRAARASDKLMAAVAQPSSRESKPSQEAVQLRERFDEAVATLKQRQRGEQSLYELPWYVIIGAPGSGKTTALLHSGLTFPVEQRQGRGGLRGVGGTRNCDWLFTDEAVFLDTAGRYTTQDSDADSDAAAWAEFLALLKKHRGRRPLNGVLVTISAADLLVQAHGARESHVQAVRRRLDEIMRELKVQLPVYLLVTKADLLAGFTEYFDDLTHEERAQVWGTTFTYEDTLAGAGPGRLRGEIDALVERLNRRVFERLSAERDPRRRTRILGFPQQVSALGDQLAEFVAEVFGSTRFDQRVLLRGVYFTSGTQEGTPIDRLLGALARRFSVASDAVPASGRGKAYFIERLLRSVVFAESGLAGVNRRVEMQKAAWQMGAYLALAAVAVVGVIALAFSYARNRAYLDGVATALERLQQAPPQPAAASLESVLPRLDAVRAVSEAANAHRTESTLLMRWGLYQGASVGDAARDAYGRELDGALLPRIAERIEARLRGGATEPEQIYLYLKAYLMLGDPRRLDKAQLAYIADQEWSQATDGTTAGALSGHFAALLEGDAALRPITPDETLVAQARSTLQQVSVAQLVYNELQLRYVENTAAPLRVNERAGVGADRVLRRKSGRPLSQPVPGLYTADVFRAVTGGSIQKIAAEYAAERWVFGDEVTAAQPPNLSDVLDLYEADYIRYWDGLLADIDVVPLGSLERTKDVLEILSRPTSPLRGLLRLVDEQTFLVKPPEAGAATGGLREKFETIFRTGREALGQTPPVPPGTKVTEHFSALHALVTGEGGNAPIDGVIRRLEELQKAMDVMGDGVGKVPATDPAANAAAGGVANSLRLDAESLPPAIGAVVTTVASGASAVVRGALRGNLDRRYEEDVLSECRKLTTGRYPFDQSSAVDLPIADFGRLFGHGGVFDQFFKNELSELVDTSRRPWAWRRDASGTSVGGAVPLALFESAGQIRDAFFRPGAMDPEVSFRLTPDDLDAATRRFTLEFDGQLLQDQHTAARTLAAKWPGEKPGPATAMFEEFSGGRPTTTTQGPWAWFRLLESARLQPESDVRYMLTFERGGHRAQVQLEAASVRHPFGKPLLQQFRCS